jgi:ribosome maturation factor RimP
MISTDKVHHIVSDILESTDIFAVDVSVKPGNKIVVLVDKLEGITIDECADISRGIEEKLDRSVEDYELEVSSPGLTLPFKVKQQYFKNIGRNVDVVLKDGQKVTGKLLNMNDNEIIVEIVSKVKAPGAKKPEIIVEQEKIEFSKIKATKVLLNF